MGTSVKSFKFRWKALNEALNKLADAINFNSPVEGAGIRLEENKSGTIISVAEKGTGGSPGTNLTDGIWRPVDVVDASCNHSTIWVWALPQGSSPAGSASK